MFLQGAFQRGYNLEAASTLKVLSMNGCGPIYTAKFLGSTIHKWCQRLVTNASMIPSLQGVNCRQPISSKFDEYTHIHTRMYIYNTSKMYLQHSENLLRTKEF